MTNQPLHCDHECVCWWYYDHKRSGTASPCQSENCHHRFRIDGNAFTLSAPDGALERAQAYMKKCTEKFQKENPCPKCGSHNVDIDWATPIFCRDCGYEWLPEKNSVDG